jgi:hypothetical protein
LKQYGEVCSAQSRIILLAALTDQVNDAFVLSRKSVSRTMVGGMGFPPLCDSLLSTGFLLKAGLSANLENGCHFGKLKEIPGRQVQRHYAMGVSKRTLGASRLKVDLQNSGVALF